MDTEIKAGARRKRKARRATFEAPADPLERRERPPNIIFVQAALGCMQIETRPVGGYLRPLLRETPVPRTLSVDRVRVAQLRRTRTMRTFDLTPFYRSTIGFDRLFSLLDQVPGDAATGYPPYNIERTGDNAYRISVAVSGFAQNELSIVAKENTLTIKGEKVAESGDKSAEVLYRGIAARAFERAFQLADYVQVKNASLENGLLHVDLVREIPEAKKPRAIPIGTGTPAPQVVDAKSEKVAA
jgi:molecular chaperone IbpA